MQRCGAHLASQTDIDEAFLAGKTAVEGALAGESGKMAGFVREYNGGKYICKTSMVPLAGIANSEKTVPLEWINAERNFVTQDFIDYALPLIQGENTRLIENGLPRFAKLKKIKINI